MSQFEIARPLLLTIQRVGERIRLAMSPAAGRWSLQVIRRGDCATIESSCAPCAYELEAWLPVTPEFLSRNARWDVRLCTVDGTERTSEPLTASPDAVLKVKRHFFDEIFDEQGVSAYLSDSLASLVLYVAPRERHAQVTTSENAKHLFARQLDELPLQENLVLFESFLGKSYAGNPRYIYEALREMRPDLQCIWVYDGNQPIPGSPKRVVRGSVEYYRLLAQAKYRVNNIKFAAHGRKPETQYLQTWHGTPLKRLGYDIDVAGPEADARESFHDESRAWTLLLSENAYSSKVLRRAFRYEGEVLEAGYPLTDPLPAPAIDRSKLAAHLGLPCDRRFILYAPTWRDHKQVGAWRFDFDLHLDLKAVSEALAPDQVLLIKAHHLVTTGLHEQPLPHNVLDVSYVDDITDLCVLADVLITDYSSVLFDYATTGRPILFYCYDLQQYAEQIRGFYLDIDHDLPGPIARSSQELIKLLADLPRVEAAYAERYAKFQECYCALNDGQAARRVVEAFFGPAPAASPFLVDLVALGEGRGAEESARLEQLVQRYTPYAGTISSLLYERLPAVERVRFLVWFLKRWGGIDRVDPVEMASYQADVARIRQEVRPPVEIGGRNYTLQDLRSQGYDFCLANYDWVLSIHDILYDQYQNEDFRIRPGDVVIDAGGFVGDTAALFCAKTRGDCYIHAFELLDENLALFEYNNVLNGIADRVVVNKLALFEHSHGSLLIKQAALQGATSVGAGDGPGERIPTIALDDYVAQHGLSRVDLIKMDIEGSEIPALRGAMQTIRRFRPKLALCLYHKWDDVMTIPSFLLATGIPYRFNFKWVQLPQGWEAVLLAQPEEGSRT